MHPRHQATEVTRAVELLGWSAEERRAMWSAPIDECPLYEIGMELARLLGRDLTLSEVGVLYGVTRERIRQVEGSALDKVSASFPEWSEHAKEIANRDEDGTKAWI
jgi:hypothetical protein